VPGYPMLLVPGTAIGFPISTAIVLNFLLSSAIVFVTFRLARRLLRNDRAAAICALVAALEPTLLLWSLKVMPETLLTLCVLLFVDAALRAIETRETRWVLAAAAILCTAAYVKPIVYPLVALICLASLLARAPRLSIAFFLACAVLLAPWHVRNRMLTGYAGFSSLMDRAVFLSAGGSIVARREHRPYEEVRQEMLRRARIRAPLDDPSRFKRIRREGVALVASDPFGYARTHAKGTLRTMFDPGATEYFRLLGMYSSGGRAAMERSVSAVARAYPLPFFTSILLAIVLAPLVLLPVLAAMRVRGERRSALVLMALVASWLLVAGGGVPGYSRFRVPAVPLLILMSALALRSLRADRASSIHRPPEAL
jgi:4-amino-4-deoxy-L-arabinose transferase-like glycosyltransferase